MKIWKLKWNTYKYTIEIDRNQFLMLHPTLVWQGGRAQHGPRKVAAHLISIADCIHQIGWIFQNAHFNFSHVSDCCHSLSCGKVAEEQCCCEGKIYPVSLTQDDPSSPTDILQGCAMCLCTDFSRLQCIPNRMLAIYKPFLCRCYPSFRRTFGWSIIIEGIAVSSLLQKGREEKTPSNFWVSSLGRITRTGKCKDLNYCIVLVWSSHPPV